MKKLLIFCVFALLFLFFQGCGNNPTIQSKGLVAFTIKETNTFIPLIDAFVSIGSTTKSTDTSGYCFFENVEVGDQSFNVSKTGYLVSTGLINVLTGSITTKEVFLTKISTGETIGGITFIVKDGFSATPISGASVSINGTIKSTNLSGLCTFEGLVSGSQSFTIMMPGYVAYSGSINIIAGSIISKQIDLALTLVSPTNITISSFCATPSAHSEVLKPPAIINWDAMLGTSIYKLSYGTNTNADNIGVIITPTNSCSLDSIIGGQTYYFKIASSNGASDSSYSSIISFNTPALFYYYYITPTTATGGPGDPAQDFVIKYNQGSLMRIFYGSIEAVVMIQASSTPPVTETNCIRKTIQELYELTDPEIMNYGFNPTGW